MMAFIHIPAYKLPIVTANAKINDLTYQRITVLLDTGASSHFITRSIVNCNVEMIPEPGVGTAFNEGITVNTQVDIRFANLPPTYDIKAKVVTQLPWITQRAEQIVNSEIIIPKLWPGKLHLILGSDIYIS